MPTLVLGFLALSAGAYRYIHNLIKQELTASMLATTGKTAETIRDFSVIDIQNIYRHRILHEKYPDIFKDIYAANRHGEYHTVRERGSKYFIFVGNIADRPHFKSIMSGGTAQITPPLVSRTTSIPTIFLVAPIKDAAGHPQYTGTDISEENMKKPFQLSSPPAPLCDKDEGDRG